MDHFEKLHKINYLVAETEAIYHQASVKLSISDSTLRILYTIYDKDGSCLLSDIYKQSGISKQTINSALRKLETDGILYLEQASGRSKRVCLTEKGQQYTENTVARLCRAEYEAFSSWTEEELDMHIHLLKKYVDDLRHQIQKL